MDWKISNALSRDIERQQLNKVLADIRATVDGLSKSTGSTGKVSLDALANAVEGNIEEGITVNYDAVKQTLDFVVNSFTIRLSGAVSGSAEVPSLNSVNISTELDPDLLGVEEAAIDNQTYWRKNAEWEAVPDQILEFATLKGEGIPILYQDDVSGFYTWIVRTLETVPGELTVTNPTGEAGNPTLGLADVPDGAIGSLRGISKDGKGRIVGTTDATITGTTGQIDVANGDAVAGPPTLSLADVADAGGGTLQKTAFDAKGRKTGTSAATTSDLAEGTNLYFTAQRVRDAVLTGLSTATNAVIAATDTVLGALGKLQAQVTANLATLTGHTGNVANPHAVTKAQVGLGNVDNTSDASKPVSTAQQAAIDGKVVQTITPGDTTHAPSGDAVNTALAGKAPLLRPQFSDWVGIGRAPDRPLTINSDTSTLPAGSAVLLLAGDGNKERIEARSTGGFDPTFQGKASGGTLAAPLATAEGKSLVTLAGSGHDGSDWINGNKALLRAFTAESWSATANGCEWRFATTPNGSTIFVYRWVATHDGHWRPYTDDVSTIGIAGSRIKEIHCANSVINTSDAREKTPLRQLDDVELAIARDLAGIVGIYQWLAAVGAKGEDGARLHCGAIAQQVIACFEAHERDAFRYGIACYDEWPETREPAQYETVEVEPAQTIDHPAIYERTQVYTAEGMPERFAERLVSPAWTEVVAPAVTEQRLVSDEVIHPAGNRYSLRYGELSMFLIAGQEARLRALEAKLV